MIMKEANIIQVRWQYNQQGMREPDSHGDPLDAMTGAIKIYKHILKEIDLFWKDAAAGAIIQDQPILSRLLNELPAAGAHIDLVGFTPIAFSRFINRLMEVISLYKNKCFGYALLKDSLEDIHRLIRQHYQSESGTTEGLFQKIVYTFRRFMSEISCRLQIQSKSLSGSLSYNKGLSPSNQTQCFEISKKSLEYKYKLSKEVMNHMSLFSGMGIDVQNLKSVFLQSRSNADELRDDASDRNKNIRKDIQNYASEYGQWRGRIRQKRKKEKEGKKAKKSQRVSPSKREKDENKASSGRQNLPTPNRLRTKGTSQLERVFLHLNEIKNVKYRRPYAEVKQVLVTGDEINFYSKQGGCKESLEVSRKASYFMNRATLRVDYGVGKKSMREGARVLSES